MKPKLYDDQLIVITGAAGFIGSGVVRFLNDKGYANLLLVDDFEKTERWKNLRHKRFVDFISKHELFDFLQGREREIEAFIHLGACSDTVEVDGDFLMKVNYRFSVKLAEYALSHGHRFIYASSAATYGNGSKGFHDDEAKLDELSPLNLYGFSKQMFDKWLKEQNVLNKVVGLKYFNIFGPNERHKGRMGSMVMHMYDQIQKEGRVRLFQSTEKEKYADGDQVRDFYYVKDAVKMTCSFLENDLSGIFNAGSGTPHTWNQMAKQVFKVLGKKPQIEYIPTPSDLVKNYQNHTVAEMSKFQNALKKKGLSFENSFTFESAIEDYVKNYLMRNTEW